MPTRAEGCPDPAVSVPTEPMRILIVCAEYLLIGGGFGSYVKVVAPALAARGHDVHILSCLGGQRRRDYRDGPVWIHERPGLHLRVGVRRLLHGQETWHRLLSAVRCWIEEARLGIPFDVVEIADFTADGLLLGLGRQRPVVAHLHGPLRLTHQYTGEPRGRDILLADWLERLTVARADLVTSSSDLIARRLRELGWLRSTTVRTVRNPIDLDRWLGVPPIGEGVPRILAVGRVEALKGTEFLVRAAAILANDIQEVEVVVIGRSSGKREGQPYRDWVQKLAADLGAPCRFVDQVPRDALRDWYASARVVAIPSLYDTFPTIGLEAMASGRPVVCSSNTGIAELLTGAETGDVVPPGDADRLAQALRPYVVDREAAHAAGERARQLMTATCAPERVAAEREHCYREARTA